MQTLFPPIEERRPGSTGVQFEAAYDCDGSRCHQPIFREDGTLNYVAPHCHLVECGANGTLYYAILCDFPESNERPRVRSADSLFATYPE